MEEKKEKIFYKFLKFFFFKRSTNFAHMQNCIQIPPKMKTGVTNVFKLVKLTLTLFQNNIIFPELFILQFSPKKTRQHS